MTGNVTAHVRALEAQLGHLTCRPCLFGRDIARRWTMDVMHGSQLRQRPPITGTSDSVPNKYVALFVTRLAS